MVKINSKKHLQSIERSQKNNKSSYLEQYIIKTFDSEYDLHKKLIRIYENNNKEKLRVNLDLKKLHTNFDKKVTECLICKHPFDGAIKNKGICNSHNIPRFILKNTEGIFNKNAALATISTISNNPNYQKYAGANKCDTFRLICRNCDGKVFSDYEEATILTNLSAELLSESQNIFRKIALKIILKDYYFYNTVGGSPRYKKTDIKVTRKLINKLLNYSQEYKLIYFNKLDYNVGFTVQDKILPNSLVTLSKYGVGKVNDLSKIDINDDVYIYICVYPIGSETVILMFTDDISTNKYKKYSKYINSVDDAGVLKNISYNLLKFTEKIYFNPNIFTEKIWSVKDKILVTSEYAEIKINSDYSELTGWTDTVADTDDYLSLKGINESTVINLFDVNKP